MGGACTELCNVCAGSQAGCKQRPEIHEFCRGEFLRFSICSPFRRRNIGSEKNCVEWNGTCQPFALMLIENVVRQFRTHKVIYRRYAGLFFSMCVDITDNELAYLESIHLFVEILDHFFSNVCELDLVFNFHKVQMQHCFWLCFLHFTHVIKVQLDDGSTIHIRCIFNICVRKGSKNRIFIHWLAGIFDTRRVYSCRRIARNE